MSTGACSPLKKICTGTCTYKLSSYKKFCYEYWVHFFFPGASPYVITCIIKKIVHMISESRNSHHKQTWNSHPTSPGRTCKSETWIQGRLYLCAWQYLKCQKSTGRKIQASRRQTQKRHQPSAKISGIGLMFSVT